MHCWLFAEDDAYYYLVIARNIAHSGVSTFDQQSLTNGYHPLAGSWFSSGLFSGCPGFS